jgi:sugar phosphate isomerase/epimerase
MTRRTFLYSAASAASLLPAAASAANEKPSPLKMGIATTSYMTVWKPKDTYEFLERCHSLGASGIQSVINGDIPKIRARAEEYGMYIEGMVPVPWKGDSSAFEQSLKNAQAVGATCLRADTHGNRRYEAFSTYEEYQEWVKQTDLSLDAMVPLLEKYKLRLGVENHKDRTADQLVGVLKRYSSEYLGACVDCGNNISLLEEPMDVIEKLAPYAVTTHFKDMGVEPYADGFLLSEVRLGEGFVNLPRVLSTLRTAKPDVHVLLEMITRDPLKVPCLTDKYWASFPDRNGKYLARTLKLVQKETNAAKPLPRISQLSHEEQLRVEEENVKACLRYGREKLEL